MHKKFDINWTEIKGSCQSGRKMVTQDSKSDLPLISHFTMRHPVCYVPAGCSVKTGGAAAGAV